MRKSYNKFIRKLVEYGRELDRVAKFVPSRTISTLLYILDIIFEIVYKKMSKAGRKIKNAKERMGNAK